MDAVRVRQEQERVINDMDLERGEMNVGRITRRSIAPGKRTCMHGKQTFSKMNNSDNKAVCDGCGQIVGSWANFA